MPKVDAGGKGDRCGGGGAGVHGIELTGAITTVKYHPGTGVLHRKPGSVKFNSKWILTSKTTNRN
jgi:hypothetical protein